MSGEGPLTEEEILAREEAYILKIQQNKEKKFQSKVFGTSLQSAREGEFVQLRSFLSDN